MSNRLRQLRRSHDLTQEQLAISIGTTRQTIIDIEKQKRNPSLELALKISNYFNINVNEIFFSHKVTQGLQN